MLRTGNGKSGEAEHEKRQEVRKNMGEMSDCYMSDEEQAIERITERRFQQRRSALSTDCLDRSLKDEIRQEVLDEFVLMNGRQPKGIFG